VPGTPFTVLIQRRYDGVRTAQEALDAARRRWYAAAVGLALVIAIVLGGPGATQGIHDPLGLSPAHAACRRRPAFPAAWSSVRRDIRNEHDREGVDGSGHDCGGQPVLSLCA
jgi:hypothetical protein